MYLKYIKQRI